LSTTVRELLTAAKAAAIDYPLQEALRYRWSPRAFADRPVEPETLRQLVEAARWAPSAGNGQPWSFMIAPREDTAEFARLLAVLNERNQTWARGAAVLLLVIAAVRRPDGKEHRLALYEVGLAVENLVIEGMTHGVFAHQMAGFNAAAARQAFDIPDGQEPVVAMALGYPGDPEALPGDLRARELAPRTRKPLADFVFRGRVGQPSPLVADHDDAVS